MSGDADRGRASSEVLAHRIRLIVLTDPAPRCGRSLEEVVAECLEAGAPAIELRDKRATADSVYEQARRLRPLAEDHGALLIVNDRLDVALAAGAHGVHLGPGDLPVAAARACTPQGFLLGYSTDDPTEATKVAGDGADYLGIGAVFGTRSKAGLENEAIGPARVGEVLAAAGIPGVGIGGIDPENAGAVAAVGAGVAVLSAVMGAERPGETVRRLLSAIS